MIIFYLKRVGCFMVSLLLLTLTGCQTQRRQMENLYKETFYPSYTPVNYTLNPVPCNITRVAVLPLMSNSVDRRDRAPLDEALCTELSKTGYFEVVFVSCDDLRNWWGVRELDPRAPLPPLLLEMLRHKIQADAILICELVTYRPYAPMAIGWRLNMIEAERSESLWGIDETFDAGYAPVALGAQRYAQSLVCTNYPFTDAPTILISPSMFARYSAFESFRNLQKRAKE